MSIPFKPRHSEVRIGLKQLKDGFDDPSLDAEELIVEFDVRRGVNDAIRAYRGEFYHQLGLRKERRGEHAAAERLYQASFEELAGNALAQARTLRDWGTMVAAHVDIQRGLRMIADALELHEQDIDNAKGRRQRRITQSYMWRARIAANTADARQAKRDLIALTAGPDFDFCVRDQKVIIDFLVPRTKGAVHRDMLARQAAILLERRKPRALAQTCAMLVIDINLSIAGSIVQRIFRKE